MNPSEMTTDELGQEIAAIATRTNRRGCLSAEDRERLEQVGDEHTRRYESLAVDLDGVSVHSLRWLRGMASHLLKKHPQNPLLSALVVISHRELERGIHAPVAQPQMPLRDWGNPEMAEALLAVGNCGT